ncbi:hypothetical protein EZS27_015722 [termite gut metagenome]|uniref:CHAT domain-containing protein n=1 Tax=termite gut metagenome TaxID=433724 RepID=A0A5J4RS12_9ZZZZ
MKRILTFCFTCVIAMSIHAQTPDEILQQANELSGVEKFEEMITLLKNNKAVFYDSKQDDYIGVYNIYLGSGFFATQKYSIAETHIIEGLNILEKAGGKYSQEYYTFYPFLSSLYSATNDTIKLEKIYLNYLDITSVVAGKNSSAYAAVLWETGIFYKNIARYENALKYFLQLQEVYENYHDKTKEVYVAILNNIGNTFMELQKYESAKKEYFQAKSICEKYNDYGHEYSMALHNIAKVYEFTDSTEIAIKYMLKAKSIQDEVLDRTSFDYYSTINSLAGYYNYLQQYNDAEKYYLEALSIQESLFGKESAEYAILLNQLGRLYANLDDYKLSEEYYIEAKQFFENNKETDGEMYANILTNLGNLYCYMVSPVIAATYFKQARSILAKLYKTNEEKYANDYANTLYNIGYLFLQSGIITTDLEDAEEYLLKAKEIQDKWEYESIFWCRTVSDLGLLYIHKRKYDIAGKYINQVKTVIEKYLGKENTSYITILNSEALLAAVERNNELAEKRFKELYELLGKVKVYDDMSPKYLTLINNIASWYFMQNKFDISLKIKQKCFDIMRRQIYRNFGIMSADQRNSYLSYNEIDILMKSYYPLTAAYITSATQSLAYNNALFSKGLLLRSTNEIRDAILNSGNQNLISQFEQLDAIRQQITALQAKTDKYEKDYIQSLEDRADSLDKALTVASVAYREQKADLNIEWKDIRNNLSDNEMAIEFIDYQKFNKEWTDTTMYAALIVRKDFENPIFVPLFEKSQLDLLLADENKDTGKRIANLYNGGSPRFYNGQKLYQLVWQPLEKYLSDIKSVYYSPSGVLNQISFAAIPVNTVLLMDKYNLHLVSSTREIVRMKTKETAFLPVHKAVEYGGIRYDVENSQDLIASTKKYKTEETPYWVSRSFSNDSTRSGWTYLQGTEEEVIEVEDILRKSNVPNIKLMGISANEESFKNLSGQSPELLHIATHGFFLADEKSIRETGFMQIVNNQNNTYINPLLRSGLLFAGANRAWKNEDVILGIEDGILTAEEIAYLNLSKTNLVVLSACETGLGEVQNSEGVFGLQRAFKLAGVKTLVMALWKVDDVATSEFMIAFYQSLLSGKTKQEAFKIAQQQIREKYKSPYYWAGFVMMD